MVLFSFEWPCAYRCFFFFFFGFVLFVFFGFVFYVLSCSFSYCCVKWIISNAMITILVKTER